MIVVSDTGRLNYLILIGHVHILPKLYGRVVIPPAVAAELSSPATPGTVKDFILNPPEWISTEAPANPALVVADLGAGEGQAIQLAIDLNAELLLCDDKAARDYACSRGLHVVGTIGVLQEGTRAGLVNFKSAVTQLRGTNFRIAKPLIDRLMNESPDWDTHLE